MTPTTALHLALDNVKGHDDFARLNGNRRQLVVDLVLACGREQLLSSNGAADQAARLVAALTHSPRLGDAAARAVRMWAGRAD